MISRYKRSDITSGSFHLDVCWLDEFTNRHSPLGRLVVWSSQHTCRWTRPLVTSLRHNDNFSHVTILKARLVNGAPGWWSNGAPCYPCVVGGRAVPAGLPGYDVLAGHDSTQLWHREEEAGHPGRLRLLHRYNAWLFFWLSRCIGGKMHFSISSNNSA